MDVHQDAADIASWLQEARQQLTASGGLSARYAAGDVDAFLSQVAAELDTGAVPDPEILHAATFRVSRLGAGYPERQVDELIRELEQRLTRSGGPEVAAGSETNPVIARITNARFRTARRDGYDMREVDDFLDEAAGALRRGEPPAPPSRFTTVRLRPGYHKQDVDALVSEIWPGWGAG